MAEKVTLVLDAATNETVSLDWPLVYRQTPEALREAGGIASFVDLGDPVVARAVELLHGLGSASHPFSALVFGGVAFRLRFPSSNDPHLGLRHPLHDVDLAIRLKDAERFRSGIPMLSRLAGSALTGIETRADFRLNTILGGRRLRFHLVDPLDGGRVGLSVLDVVADEFRFCHTFDLRGELAGGTARPPTLSPTLLFLTKMQFVQRLSREKAEEIPDRILGPFGAHDTIVGAEDKDIRDVLALLNDAPIGSGPDALSPGRLTEILSADWGTWNTVRLNTNQLKRSRAFATLPDPVQNSIGARIDSIRSMIESLIPRRGRPRLRREWWETVDSSDDRGAPGVA